MLLRERRDARAFAAAVDGEGHLDDPGISTLVALSQDVRRLPPVRPSADFSADLRARLLTAAQQDLTPRGHGRAPTARPAHNRMRLGVATLTSAAVLVGGGAGLASASASALPGDLLYPVKRGIEQVDLAVAGDLGQRGRAELDRARTRLTEVDGLLRSDHSDRDSRITTSLVDFTRSATAGRTLLLQSYASTGQAGDLAAMQEFAIDSGNSLNAMASLLPATADAAFTSAADVVVGMDKEVEQTCSTCTPGGGSVSVPVPGDPAGPGPDDSSDEGAIVDSPGEASGPTTETSDPEDPASQSPTGGTASPGPTEDPGVAPAPAPEPTDPATEAPAGTAPSATAPNATDQPQPTSPTATAPSETAPSDTTPSDTSPSDTSPSNTSPSNTSPSETATSQTPTSDDGTTEEGSAPSASSDGDPASVPSDAASSEPAPSEPAPSEPPPSDAASVAPDSAAPPPDSPATTASGDEVDSPPTDGELAQ